VVSAECDHLAAEGTCPRLARHASLSAFSAELPAHEHPRVVLAAHGARVVERSAVVFAEIAARAEASA